MVQIIDDWYFGTDGAQYILFKKYPEDKLNRKKRKGAGEVHGYFTSLDKLLKRLIQILVKDQVNQGKIKTISEYIKALDELTFSLKEITEY